MRIDARRRAPPPPTRSQRRFTFPGQSLRRNSGLTEAEMRRMALEAIEAGSVEVKRLPPARAHGALNMNEYIHISIVRGLRAK